MKKVINFIFAVGNFVWVPFVCWKVYTWFAPEVGFELPELSFLNVFALRLVIEMFNNNVDVLLRFRNLSEKEEVKDVGLDSIKFIVFSAALLINYLIKILIF